MLTKPRRQQADIERVCEITTEIDPYAPLPSQPVVTRLLVDATDAATSASERAEKLREAVASVREGAIKCLDQHEQLCGELRGAMEVRGEYLWEAIDKYISTTTATVREVGAGHGILTRLRDKFIHAPPAEPDFTSKKPGDGEAELAEAAE